MVLRQVNVDNMKSQAYGVLKPSSHMPLTFAIFKDSFFFKKFP
jgi:hypothetical protein